MGPMVPTFDRSRDVIFARAVAASCDRLGQGCVASVLWSHAASAVFVHEVLQVTAEFLVELLLHLTPGTANEDADEASWPSA